MQVVRASDVGRATLVCALDCGLVHVCDKCDEMGIKVCLRCIHVHSADDRDIALR